MYKLTDQESAELGIFLRTLCRMGMLSEAKRVANMSDGELSVRIQTDKLWRTVTPDEEERRKDVASPRAIDKKTFDTAISQTLADSLERSFSKS